MITFWLFEPIFKPILFSENLPYHSRAFLTLFFILGQKNTLFPGTHLDFGRFWRSSIFGQISRIFGFLRAHFFESSILGTKNNLLYHSRAFLTLFFILGHFLDFSIFAFILNLFDLIGPVPWENKLLYFFWYFQILIIFEILIFFDK